MKKRTYYACDIIGDEVWRADKRRLIADIEREHRVSAKEAERMLESATPDSPVNISSNTIAWSENGSEDTVL